ncbi:hypothetical protein EEJ42_04645 [Streptomyces botrytidirepellens]|uniref:Transposase n=1 Tax=Streptomyces botrytidirepellens TaxID=2486417 RepID=A0A3M8WYF0_9ACTN|nr:hypothetical protein EEJ42_04645 [Streptomyces botrytidirepellens]
MPSACQNMDQPFENTFEKPPRPFRLDQPVAGWSVPLTDTQWARIEPLLPDRTLKRGGRWRDHRLLTARRTSSATPSSDASTA